MKTPGTVNSATNKNRSAAQGYSLEYIESLKNEESETVKVYHDDSMNQWRLTFQLEPTRFWFLSVFVNDSGKIDKYSLDYEAASDSHYEFDDADSVRGRLLDHNSCLYLHELFIRFIQERDGFALLCRIRPCITAEYHFD